MNVYDFDRTIYKSDSTLKFYLFCLKRHPKIIKFTPSLISAFLKYKRNRLSKTQFKEIMYKFLTCIDSESEAELFWKKQRNGIKTWYLEHKKPDDLIISASPLFLLQPICKNLNITNLIASNVDPKTGKYNGYNCHGEEKVTQMYKIYGKFTPEEFYSDSYIDTPLAAISAKSFLVKGNNLTPWDFSNTKIHKKYHYDVQKIRNNFSI